MSSIRQKLIAVSVIASWALGALGAICAFRGEAPVSFQEREIETPTSTSNVASDSVPRRVAEQSSHAERRMKEAEREMAKLRGDCALLSRELQRSRQDVIAARSALENLEALRRQEFPFTTLGTLLLDPANTCGIRENFEHLSQYFPDKVDAARLTQLVADSRFRSMSSTGSRPGVDPLVSRPA